MVCSRETAGVIWINFNNSLRNEFNKAENGFLIHFQIHNYVK